MAINGEITGQHEYTDMCLGSVEFRTNGPQGGDAGHGGFLEITLTNKGGTCLEVVVDGKEFDVNDRVSLNFRGDAEMRIAVECLEFLAAKLRAAQSLM